MVAIQARQWRSIAKRLRGSLLIALACTASSLLAALPAIAATGTWNGGVGATWDTSTTNWLNLSGIPWDVTNGGTNTAVFNTAGASASVSGTVFVNGITFTNTGTISGGSISLAGTTPIITTTTNGWVNSILTGSMGFQKMGSRPLIVSTSNTYLGVTRLSGGALNSVVFANGGVASSIGMSSNAASNLVIETGAQINGSGTTDRLFTLGSSGQAWVGSAGGSLVFTNTGTIAVSGSATHDLRLNGAVGGNSFAPIVVDFNASNATGLVVQNTLWTITATTSTYTGRTNIDAGGTLVASSLADGGVASSIGASSNAASNLVFGADAGGGNTTLRYAGAAAASTDRLFRINAGTPTIDNSGGGALSFTNTGSISVTSTASTTLTFTGSNAINFAPAIVNGSGTVGLIKNGTSALVLTGSSTYTGTTAINQGTLQIGNGGATGGLSPSSAITGSAGATLAFNRSNTVTQGIDFNSAIGGSVNVAQNGVGTLVLSGSNAYSGVTTLSAGRLNINHANAIGTGTFTISGGSLDNASASALSLATNNPQNWNGDFTFVGTNPLNLGTGAVTLGTSRQVTVTSSTLTVGGTIAGSGLGLTKTGAGTIVVGAASTYTGTTTISQGTLQVGNGGPTGGLSPSSAITGSSGATLAFNRTNTVTQGTDFTSVIGGGVRVAQNGAGTLVLNGSNSYTGGTVISSGILTAGTTTALGTGTATVNGGTLQYAAPMPNVAATVVNNGGTLAVKVGGSGFTSGNLDQLFSGTGGTVLNAGAIVALDTANGAFTYSSVIAGNTGIQKIGANSLVLSASNTYLGVTRLSSSSPLNSVVLANGGQPSSIGASSNAASNLIIESGAQINMSGTTDRLFTLGSAGGQAWLGGSGGSFAFTNSGTIAVSGAVGHNLRLAGGFSGLFAPSIRDFDVSNKTFFTVQNNVFQITGTTSDYTGVTNIDAGGTLVASSLANGGVASSIGASSSAASNLVFGYDAAGFNNTLRYAGTAAASTDRLFTLGSLLQAGVVTTIDNSGGGSLSFTNTGPIAVSSTASTTLAFTGSSAINFAPAIVNGSGTVGLMKAGANVLTLSGSSPYSGATSVTAGQLQIAPTGSINSTSGITVNGTGAEFKYNSATTLSRALTLAQGTLSGTGSIGTAVTVGSSAILSPGNSPGSQAFTSGLTFASGGQYTWEINDWTGAVSSAYDQLVVSGSALNITATSGSTFRIAVTGLTAGNVSGTVPNFSGSAGTSFTIATSAAGITGFDKTKFAIDTSAFTNNNTLPTNAGFWVSQSGNNLRLNYAPSATYVLSSTASATAIRVGGTSAITATVTSSTVSLTNPDQLVFAGLAVTGAGALSATTGTLAPGSSTSGSVAFTTASAGSYTFTPSITSGSNVNIGTAANAGSTSAATVTVWNPAAANTLSGTINFGTVLKGTTLSQTLSISNTAPNNGFSEKLDATFGTPFGDATTSGGPISLLAAGGTSTALSVGLDSATAGGKSGSVQVDFASNGAGTSGLGTLSLAPQTVNLVGTVLDPATALLVGGTASGSAWSIDLGEFNQGTGTSSPFSFGISNLLQTVGYTADLDLTSFSLATDSGAIFTTLSGTSFPTLLAGGTNSFSAWMSLGTTGTFSNIYNLGFNSSKNGTGLGGTPQNVTLTVTGVIVVPEPGAIALAGIGIAAAAWVLKRRK